MTKYLSVIQAGIAARLRVKESAITVRYAESTFAGAPKGIIDESESLRADWKNGKQFMGYVTVNRPSSITPFDVTEICTVMADKLKSAVGE